MKLEILSVTGVIAECEISSIILPGVQGSFGIWPNHTPMISVLKEGIITYFNPEKNEIEIKGGFVKIQSNAVTVCLD
jgi:F-type H+-transporting ATPase subunit epsilon